MVGFEDLCVFWCGSKCEFEILFFDFFIKGGFIIGWWIVGVFVFFFVGKLYVISVFFLNEYCVIWVELFLFGLVDVLEVVKFWVECFFLLIWLIDYSLVVMWIY